MKWRLAGTITGLAVLMAAFSVSSPYFLTGSNLLNVVLQSAILTIIAAGMTVVVIGGGIDLSLGSIVAVSGLVAADVLHHGGGLVAALPAGLLCGALLGAVNGMLVSWLRLPPFIATLGTMSLLRGIALLYAGGGSISGFGPEVRAIAEESLLGLPVPVVLMGVAIGSVHVILTRTRFGRAVYAIGGNERAAFLAGISVQRIKVLSYACGGLFGGLGAVVLTARLNSAQSVAGLMYELDAIAAIVIGGTSLSGGVGSVGGTLVGALMMGVLRNGLNLLDTSAYVQQVVIGGVIIAAVAVDLFVTRRLQAFTLPRVKG